VLESRLPGGRYFARTATTLSMAVEGGVHINLSELAKVQHALEAIKGVACRIRSGVSL
jgi:hypothetical protein